MDNASGTLVYTGFGGRITYPDGTVGIAQDDQLWKIYIERRPESKPDQETATTRDANRSPFANNEHHDHKDGEGVKWDGGGAPPLGVDCEYRIGGGGIPWHPCTVRYVLEGDNDPDADGWRAVIWCPNLEKDQVASLDRFQFRPIQSHRDKVIEAAERVIEGVDHQMIAVTAQIAALYDAGMLVYPGDDQ